MKMTQKERAKLIGSLISEYEYTPIKGELTGKILVLDPTVLKPEYQKKEFLLFKAGGGFGCSEGKIGTAVFGQFLADGEGCRYERYDFIGIYTGTIPEECKFKE